MPTTNKVGFVKPTYLLTKFYFYIPLTRASHFKLGRALQSWEKVTCVAPSPFGEEHWKTKSNKSPFVLDYCFTLRPVWFFKLPTYFVTLSVAKSRKIWRFFGLCPQNDSKNTPTKTDKKIQWIMDTIWTQHLIRKAQNLFGLGFLNGGGGGIRTHGTLVTYDGFQDRSDKPLWHSSEFLVSE